jgi:hypothetical protein
MRCRSGVQTRRTEERVYCAHIRNRLSLLRRCFISHREQGQILELSYCSFIGRLALVGLRPRVRREPHFQISGRPQPVTRILGGSYIPAGALPPFVRCLRITAVFRLSRRRRRSRSGRPSPCGCHTDPGPATEDQQRGRAQQWNSCSHDASNDHRHPLLTPTVLVQHLHGISDANLVAEDASALIKKPERDRRAGYVLCLSERCQGRPFSRDQLCPHEIELNP